MKKFVSLMLALIMVLSLAACGGDKTTTSTPSSTPGTTTTPGTSTTPTTPGTSTTPSTPGTSTTEPAAPTVANPERYGGALNIRWNTMAETLDPHVSSGWGAYFWSAQCFENAIYRDVKGNLHPGVCNFELSDDELTLKLWVRDGAKFHNGKAVTVEDVEASLLRACNNATVQQYIGDLLESHEIKDGVLTLKFKEYNLNTIFNLSRGNTLTVIMPKEICEKYPLNGTSENPIMTPEDCIGSGPYQVVDWEANNFVRMKRFEDYVSVETDASGLAGPKYAYMDEIVMWLNTDEVSTVMGQMNGDYTMSRINSEYDEQFAALGHKIVMESPINCYFTFNTKGDRVVNDKNLRKAIAAAMSDGVIEKIRKYYEVDYCPMDKGPYWTDEFAKTDYLGGANADVVKKYLAQSNYKGEELVFLVSGQSDTVAVTAQSVLKQYGINVTLEYMDATAVKTYIKDGSNPFDMYYMTSAVCELMPNNMAANLYKTFWGNAEKDKLFADISTTRYGTPESLEIWDKIVDLWIEECPTVILAHTMSAWTVHGDLELNNEGSFFYYWNAYYTNPSAHPSKFKD